MQDNQSDKLLDEVNADLCDELNRRSKALNGSINNSETPQFIARLLPVIEAALDTVMVEKHGKKKWSRSYTLAYLRALTTGLENVIHKQSPRTPIGAITNDPDVADFLAKIAQQTGTDISITQIDDKHEPHSPEHTD